MVTLAKMMDDRIVEIVRVTDTVGFSEAQGWMLICYDFEKINRKRDQFKWMPSTTPFIWVRDYSFH